MDRAEAIRRIKAWNLDSDDMEVLAVIIPELTESEDERIRKDICTWLKHKRETCTYPTPKKETLSIWISYLEKQKEQKPLSTEETELNSVAFLEQMGYTCIPPGAKPAEWSAADEEMLDAMIDIVSNSLYEPLCPREGMLDWLLSLRPRWKPSEEQMQGLRRGIVKADEGSDAKNAMVSLYNDLLKL